MGEEAEEVRDAREFGDERGEGLEEEEEERGEEVRWLRGVRPCGAALWRCGEMEARCCGLVEGLVDGLVDEEDL